MSEPFTVVIIAPQGAGKSRHAETLRAMFGCTSIVDEWDGVTPLPPGALALTNTQIAEPACPQDEAV